MAAPVRSGGACSARGAIWWGWTSPDRFVTERRAGTDEHCLLVFPSTRPMWKASALAGIALLWLGGCSSNRDEPTGGPAVAVEAVPPHPASASPYLNTRLEVTYVGDARCAEC